MKRRMVVPARPAVSATVPIVPRERAKLGLKWGASTPTQVADTDARG